MPTWTPQGSLRGPQGPQGPAGTPASFDIGTLEPTVRPESFPTGISVAQSSSAAWPALYVTIETVYSNINRAVQTVTAKETGRQWRRTADAAQTSGWTPFIEMGMTGPQGPQGIQGVQGPQGPTGATGSQGPAGTAATVTVTGTTTTAAGTQAAVSSGGTATARTLAFSIPQGAVGATGATGPTGPTGATGPTGPANNLTVGTVTTVPTTTLAPALPVGLKPLYVFSFSTASTPRPTADTTISIEWRGPVQPVNAFSGDTWVNISA